MPERGSRGRAIAGVFAGRIHLFPMHSVD